MLKSSLTNEFSKVDPTSVGSFVGRIRAFVRRFGTSILFAAIAFLTIADLIEDRVDGAPWGHLLMEAMIVGASVIGAAVLWRRGISELRTENSVLRTQLATAHADAERWREEAASLLRGLGVAISHQFDRWNLSSAERDVGLFLLKGLSHKEIAALRETSERTVRQQAASVYAKAGIEGRYQLSAFFLEDLLLPVESGNNGN